MTPDEVIDALAADWSAIAARFVSGAPNVSAYYVHGAHSGGVRHTNAYFEQDGEVRFPGAVMGVDGRQVRAAALQRALGEKMRAAGSLLVDAGVPVPVEYWLRVDARSGSTDLQTEYELRSEQDRRETSQSDRVAYWLGDRAPQPSSADS